jgi:hypothetical protein
VSCDHAEQDATDRSDLPIHSDFGTVGIFDNDRAQSPKLIVSAEPLDGHTVPTQVRSVSPEATQANSAPPMITPNRHLFALEHLPEKIGMVEQLPSFAFPTSLRKFSPFAREVELGEKRRQDVNVPGTIGGAASLAVAGPDDDTADSYSTLRSSPTRSAGSGDEMQDDLKPRLLYYPPQDKYMVYHPSMDPPPPPPAQPSGPLTLSKITKRQQMIKSKAKVSKLGKRAPKPSGRIIQVQPHLEPNFDEEWTSFGGETATRGQGGLATKVVDPWGATASDGLGQPRFGGW